MITVTSQDDSQKYDVSPRPIFSRDRDNQDNDEPAFTVRKNDNQHYKKIDKVKILNEEAMLIKNGDYDEKIIEVFRSCKIDLSQLTSGNVAYNKPGSGYKLLAAALDLDPDDDEVLYELFRIIEYNLRNVRGRISQENKKNTLLFKQKEMIDLTKYPEPPPRAPNWPYVSLYQYPTEPAAPKPYNQRVIHEIKQEPIKLAPRPTPTPISSPSPQKSPTPPPPSPPRPPPSPPPPEQKSPTPSPEQKSPTPPTHPHILKIRPPEGDIHKRPQHIDEVKVVNWGREAQTATCPRCGYSGETRVNFKIGKCSWICAIVMFLSLIFLPCSWFPFAMPMTKDAMHICRRCHFILGIVPRGPCSKQPENWDWDKNEVHTPKKFQK